MSKKYIIFNLCLVFLLAFTLSGDLLLDLLVGGDAPLHPGGRRPLEVVHAAVPAFHAVLAVSYTHLEREIYLPKMRGYHFYP